MERHALVPERAAELPSPLAARYVGQAHTHQYLAASRVTGQNWGPQQVGPCTQCCEAQWERWKLVTEGTEEWRCPLNLVGHSSARLTAHDLHHAVHTPHVIVIAHTRAVIIMELCCHHRDTCVCMFVRV